MPFYFVTNHSVGLLRQSCCRAGMCGAAFYSAGRGKGKNPRGGAGRRWKSAGRGGAKKRANQPIQNFYKSAKNIILHIIILGAESLRNQAQLLRRRWGNMKRMIKMRLRGPICSNGGSSMLSSTQGLSVLIKIKILLFICKHSCQLFSSLFVFSFHLWSQVGAPCKSYLPYPCRFLQIRESLLSGR